MPQIFKIKLLRFDPSQDAKPYHKTYEVPYSDQDLGPMSALKALHYIHQNIEPIGYDYHCRFGGCGRCAIMFDAPPWRAGLL
jgi:succinate dehydrogenase/fumarate reductase-like Fe-S protein